MENTDDLADRVAVILDTYEGTFQAREDNPLMSLMTDIAHYCDKSGYKLIEIIDEASAHYMSETKDRGRQFKCLVE